MPTLLLYVIFRKIMNQHVIINDIPYKVILPRIFSTDYRCINCDSRKHQGAWWLRGEHIEFCCDNCVRMLLNI